MIVRTLASILNTAAHVKGDAFESRRILLAADGLGYSLHDTLCKAGTEQHLEYKNHVETNYVIEGQGEVVNVATGQTWPLGPGTVYVLVPKGSGALKLEDPRLSRMMAAPARRADAPAEFQPFIYAEPKAGTVFLWESWLTHEVVPSKAKTDRISISFNYR